MRQSRFLMLYRHYFLNNHYLSGKFQKTMNRIFHARITWSDILFVLIAAGVTFWAFWIKQVLVAVFFLLMLVVVIERLIHTTFTLTANSLVLSYGRFNKGKTIFYNEITKVEPFKGLLIHGVVVHYGEKRFVALRPQKEEEFIREVEKLRMNIEH